MADKSDVLNMTGYESSLRSNENPFGVSTFGKKKREKMQKSVRPSIVNTDHATFTSYPKEPTRVAVQSISSAFDAKVVEPFRSR